MISLTLLPEWDSTDSIDEQRYHWMTNRGYYHNVDLTIDSSKGVEMNSVITGRPTDGSCAVKP